MYCTFVRTNSEAETKNHPSLKYCAEAFGIFVSITKPISQDSEL